MGYYKCVSIIFLLHLCLVMLCASLPLTYRQTGRTGLLSKKLFPGEERSIQDSYGQYPWSRDDRERTGLLPSEDKSRDETTASRVREMERNLLQNILALEKRRLEQDKQSKDTNEKREPQRCMGGWMGGNGCKRRGLDTMRGEVLNKETRALMDREVERSLMDGKDIDMELERALRELDLKVPGVNKMM